MYITMLRDPVDVFESLWNYSGMRSFYHMDLEKFAISPKIGLLARVGYLHFIKSWFNIRFIKNIQGKLKSYKKSLHCTATHRKLWIFNFKTISRVLMLPLHYTPTSLFLWRKTWFIKVCSNVSKNILIAFTSQLIIP